MHRTKGSFASKRSGSISIGSFLLWACSVVIGFCAAGALMNHIGSAAPMGSLIWPLLLLAGVTFSIGIRHFLVPFAARSLVSFSPHAKVVWVLAHLMLGVFAVAIIPVDVPMETSPLLWRISRILGRPFPVLILYGADAVTLGAVLFGVSLWLISRGSAGRDIAASSDRDSGGHRLPEAGLGGPNSVSPSQNRWRGTATWLSLSLPFGLMWCGWLLVFWPCLMTNPDSTMQWKYMLDGYVDQFQSAFFSLTIWLESHIYASPVPLALVQVGVLSLALAWGMARMRRAGAPLLVLGLTYLLLLFSPVNATMVINVGKDEPFNIAILVLSLFVLEVVLSQGAWLSRHPLAWIGFGITSALIALYRHNGLPVGFGTLAALLAFYPRYWRSWSGAFALGIAAWLAAQPLYAIIGKPHPEPTSPLRMVLAHQIAAHVSAGTALNADESYFLESVHPLKDRWNYQPWDVGGISLWSDPNAWPTVEANVNRFYKLYGELAWRNPSVNLNHILRSSSYVWRVTSPDNVYLNCSCIKIKNGQVYNLNCYGPIDGVGGDPSAYGLYSSPILPALRQPLAEAVTRTEGVSVFNSDIVNKPDISWLFWRPALYLYLLIGAAAIASLRANRWCYLLIALPVTLQSLVLIPVSPGQEFRYLWSVQLVSILFCGWLYFGVPCCGRLGPHSAGGHEDAIRTKHRGKRLWPVIGLVVFFGGISTGLAMVGTWAVWPYMTNREENAILIKTLRSSEAQARSDAAQRLGDKGPEAATATEQLTRLIRVEYDDGVRGSAAVALEKIQGSATAAAVPVLVQTLSVPDPALRREVARALARLSRAVSEALEPLAALLADDDSEIRRISAGALVAGRPPNWEAAIPVLIECVKRETGAPRRERIVALGEAEAAAAAAIKPLKELLHDPDRETRGESALALEKIRNQEATDAIPVIVESLQSNAPTRIRCLKALARLGPSAGAAVESLLPLFDDMNATVRSCAAVAFFDIRMEAEPMLVQRIVQGLSNQDAELRFEAACCLAVLRQTAEGIPEDADILAALLEGLKSPSVNDRHRAIQAITRLGAAAASAADALIDLLNDPDMGIRTEAATAIATIQKK